MGTLIMISGANGSGKSRYAERIVARTTGERYYIATMRPCSEENLQLLYRTIRHGALRVGTLLAMI